jgi:putative tryptophan/tyrosine transport system substrate-binding protein
MNRRESIVLLALAVTGATALGAQQARKPRIGYLMMQSISEPPSRDRQAFLDGLREQGYVPGQTVEMVYHSAEDEPEFMDATAQDLVAKNVDVIVVAGAVAALSAKRATEKIPIVMLAVGDPVGAGMVTSLSRPGGNVTGVSFISSELAPKRLQLIRDLVPSAKRIAVLWDARNANARAESKAVLATAPKLGMAAEPYALSTSTELSRALDALHARRPDVLYVVFDAGLVAGSRTTLAEFALRQRVPLVSGWSFITEAGGLISYAPDIPAIFRRGAYFVHRVLQGAKPADLPIEMPTRIELVVNLKTARALGIAVPSELLLLADRVIQ